jgi:CRP-like cAMP-binding protein
MYILVEGLADVLIAENGKMVKVSQLHPGQFFGEMSLLTGEPRSADVVATTDLAVYQLQRDHLAKTFKDHPDFVEKISEIIVERKYRNAQKIKELEESTRGVPTVNTNLLIEKIRALFKPGKPADTQVKNLKN